LLIGEGLVRLSLLEVHVMRSCHPLAARRVYARDCDAGWLGGGKA